MPVDVDDGIHGNELWQSDGTTGGTFLLDDIYPGSTGTSVDGIEISSVPNSSNPSDLTDVDGTLFFTANDGVHGVELWALNGNDGSGGGSTDTFPPSAGLDGFDLPVQGATTYGFTVLFQDNVAVDFSSVSNSSSVGISDVIGNGVVPSIVSGSARWACR